MNNQILESKSENHNIILIAIIIILLISALTLSFYSVRLSNPYVRSVLSIQGDKIRGEAIFEVNCAVCHGSKGSGYVGPNIQNIYKHKSKIDLINQVISGKTPPMPKFQPSTKDMADLLIYLQDL